mgnify:FL=1
MTWDGYVKLFGTQIMQSAGNVLTLGATTAIQESSAAYQEIITGIAAKAAGLSVEDFNKIDPKFRDKALMEVVNSGQGVNQATAIGIGSAGLEFAGNMLMIGGTKVATKGMFNAFVKKRYKEGLQKLGQAADDVVVATAGEVGTEIAQVGLNKAGVAATLGNSITQSLNLS